MEALFGADYERITDDNAVDLEADVEDLTATWKACATPARIDWWHGGLDVRS